MSTGPSTILGLGRVTTRARIDRRSKPDAEYTGRPDALGTVNGKATGTGRGKDIGLWEIGCWSNTEDIEYLEETGRDGEGDDKTVFELVE